MTRRPLVSLTSYHPDGTATARLWRVNPDQIQALETVLGRELISQLWPPELLRRAGQLNEETLMWAPAAH